MAISSLNVTAHLSALAARTEMTCDSYMAPRLAAVYDALNPPAADTAFYLDLAGGRPRTVLDMGCGTGWLAAELAMRGHDVTGADPAGTMLDLARIRPGGDQVAWVRSDAAGLDLATRFDLIVMTGHVFQVFLDDATTLASLRNLRRHLAPGGRLAFETRNPAVQEWREWTEAGTARQVDLGGTPVTVHYQVTGVSGDIITYETHFGFAADDRAVATGRLRFVDRDSLQRLMAQAGFAEIAWYGDWDRSAATDTSPEIIVVAG